MMKYPFKSFVSEKKDSAEMQFAADQFYEFMNKRRTVRDFDVKPVSKQIIQKLLLTAGTSPSGAHKQPWTFCAVSSPEIKSEIRKAAEKEERESYEGRMSEEWLRDLEPFGTNWEKPFLEEAPWLIIVFRKAYLIDEKGEKSNTYYSQESVGIACGILLSAIHSAGLVALTHTPSPMNFLCRVLNRPENERPFLLIPVGYPKPNVLVPDIERNSIHQIAEFYE